MSWTCTGPEPSPSPSPSPTPAQIHDMGPGEIAGLAIFGGVVVAGLGWLSWYAVRKLRMVTSDHLRLFWSYGRRRWWVPMPEEGYGGSGSGEPDNRYGRLPSRRPLPRTPRNANDNYLIDFNSIEDAAEDEIDQYEVVGVSVRPPAPVPAQTVVDVEVHRDPEPDNLESRLYNLFRQLRRQGQVAQPPQKVQPVVPQPLGGMGAAANGAPPAPAQAVQPQVVPPVVGAILPAAAIGAQPMAAQVVQPQVLQPVVGAVLPAVANGAQPAAAQLVQPQVVPPAAVAVQATPANAQPPLGRLGRAPVRRAPPAPLRRSSRVRRSTRTLEFQYDSDESADSESH